MLALFTGLLPGRSFRAGHVGYGEYPPPVGLHGRFARASRLEAGEL
jgi:hypothetical protein